MVNFKIKKNWIGLIKIMTLDEIRGRGKSN